MSGEPRFIVRDVREMSHTELTGKIREPWQVIDISANRIVVEFASKRAAVRTARDLNRLPAGCVETPDQRQGGPLRPGVTGEREQTNMDAIRLTNGNETFQISQITSDNLGPAHGKDSRGSGYTRCDSACEHEFAPAGRKVWHDDEHTEELWEDA